MKIQWPETLPELINYKAWQLLTVMLATTIVLHYRNGLDSKLNSGLQLGLQGPMDCLTAAAASEAEANERGSSLSDIKIILYRGLQ